MDTCMLKPARRQYTCTILYFGMLCVPSSLFILHVKAMLHGAIFLATCNAILLLRDVKLPNTSLHYTPPRMIDNTR